RTPSHPWTAQPCRSERNGSRGWRNPRAGVSIAPVLRSSAHPWLSSFRPEPGIQAIGDARGLVAQLREGERPERPDELPVRLAAQGGQQTGRPAVALLEVPVARGRRRPGLLHRLKDLLKGNLPGGPGENVAASGTSLDQAAAKQLGQNPADQLPRKSAGFLDIFERDRHVPLHHQMQRVKGHNRRCRQLSHVEEGASRRPAEPSRDRRGKAWENRRRSGLLAAGGLAGAGGTELLQFGERAVTRQAVGIHPGRVEEIESFSHVHDLVERRRDLGGSRHEVAPSMEQSLEAVPHPREVDDVDASGLEIRRQVGQDLRRAGGLGRLQRIQNFPLGSLRSVQFHTLDLANRGPASESRRYRRERGKPAGYSPTAAEFLGSNPRRAVPFFSYRFALTSARTVSARSMSASSVRPSSGYLATPALMPNP